MMNVVITVPEAVVQGVSRAELFRQADPGGGLMTITAVLVVFSALASLFVIFLLLGKLFKRLATPKAAPAKCVPVDVVAAENPAEISGEIYAAIAMAMYQYSKDLHDVENTVLTINRGAKAYSPWSSKIYGLRQVPDKR